MKKQGVGTTITQHILNQQRENPEATGAFTILLNELIVAAKVISREVNKAGLVDILGSTGRVNIQDEQVQKLDIFANQVTIERMQHIGQLCCMGSEENADVIEIPSHYPKGNYIILFDPLDGSSNIDVNVKNAQEIEKTLQQKIARLIEKEARLTEQKKKIQVKTDRLTDQLSKIKKIKSEMSEV